ncbi:MAG: hypothetical protein AAGE86_00505 [Pseudomonadota bacterium]
MIPLLPELTAPSSTPKPVFGPPAAKLLQDGSQERDAGATSAAIAFDDLIAAAFKTPEPATEPVVRGFQVAEDTMAAPDLKALPGKGLPNLGKEMPGIAELSVSPHAKAKPQVDRPAALPEAKLVETGTTSPVAVASSETTEPLQSAPLETLKTDTKTTEQQVQREPQVLPQSQTEPETESPLAMELVKPEISAAERNVQSAEAKSEFDQPPRAQAAAGFLEQAGDAPKEEPAIVTPAAPDDPGLAAFLRPTKNMRDNQPVPTDDQPRMPVVGRTGVSPKATMDGAPDGVEPELTRPDALKTERGSAAPSQQPATPSQTAPAVQASLPSADTAQPAPPPAAPSFQAAPGALSQAPEFRTEARMVPQIEQAIDALTDAREAGRTARPEVLVRHSEFGLVSMRLDAAGGDLRATLASRDPGFVPAIHAALSERAVAASSETTSSHNQQRGQEPSQSSANSQTFSGNSGGFGQNYGSSPGSSQGSSQPRMAQQEATLHGADEGDPSGTAELPSPNAGGGGVFA